MELADNHNLTERVAPLNHVSVHWERGARSKPLVCILTHQNKCFGVKINVNVLVNGQCQEYTYSTITSEPSSWLSWLGRVGVFYKREQADYTMDPSAAEKVKSRLTRKNIAPTQFQWPQRQSELGSHPRHMAQSQAFKAGGISATPSTAQSVDTPLAQVHREQRIEK